MSTAPALMRMPWPMKARVVPATSLDGSITEMVAAPPAPASAVAIAFMSDHAWMETLPEPTAIVGVPENAIGAAPAGEPTKASTVPLTVALASAPVPPTKPIARFWLVASAL